MPSTIAEMLLQSFQGKLRLFADWPMTADARFGDLRAPLQRFKITLSVGPIQLML